MTREVRWLYFVLRAVDNLVFLLQEKPQLMDFPIVTILDKKRSQFQGPSTVFTQRIGCMGLKRDAHSAPGNGLSGP